VLFLVEGLIVCDLLSLFLTFSHLPTLSPAQVDSTQNISEYDETTQAAIRKIMFEQKQKVRPGMSWN
jgi:hypothetical protein